MKTVWRLSRSGRISVRLGPSGHAQVVAHADGFPSALIRVADRSTGRAKPRGSRVHTMAERANNSKASWSSSGSAGSGSSAAGHVTTSKRVGCLVPGMGPVAARLGVSSTQTPTPGPSVGRIFVACPRNPADPSPADASNVSTTAGPTTLCARMTGDGSILSASHRGRHAFLAAKTARQVVRAADIHMGVIANPAAKMDSVATNHGW